MSVQLTRRCDDVQRGTRSRRWNTPVGDAVQVKTTPERTDVIEEKEKQNKTNQTKVVDWESEGKADKWQAACVIPPKK